MSEEEKEKYNRPITWSWDSPVPTLPWQLPFVSCVHRHLVRVRSVRVGRPQSSRQTADWWSWAPGWGAPHLDDTVHLAVGWSTTAARLSPHRPSSHNHHDRQHLYNDYHSYCYNYRPHNVARLVAWHSSRMMISDRRTFPVLRSTCRSRVTTYVGKLSVIDRSANRVNSAFHPFGVDKWAVSCN